MYCRKIGILCFLLTIATYFSAAGQGRVLMGQYFQNLPVFSPSMTGVNDYLDIKTGYRQQWSGLEGNPQTFFLGAYGSIVPYKHNNRRISQKISEATAIDEASLKRGTPLKIGVGGYVLSDRQGPFRQQEGLLNTAVHVPVRDRTYISLGVSSGISNAKIDLSNITLRNQVDDQTYMSFVQNGASNTFFNLNAGLSLHSDRYSIAYGVMNMTSVILDGNPDVSNGNGRLRHHILASYVIGLNERMELIPSAFLRLDPVLPTSYDLNIRWRYQKDLWLGLSYRNNSSMIGMFGLDIRDRITLGYAYEFSHGDNNINNGSHEIVLGAKLKKKQSL